MPASRFFDGFVEYTKRVSPTCLVHLERNRYSVPASFANRPVSLRVYPDRVVVAAEGLIVCEHRRVIDRSHDRPGQRSMTGGIIWLSIASDSKTAPRSSALRRSFEQNGLALRGHHHPCRTRQACKTDEAYLGINACPCPGNNRGGFKREFQDRVLPRA
ncbi:hypothetical protein ACVWWD_000935 [Mesorhizobium sp. URHB0026]